MKLQQTVFVRVRNFQFERKEGKEEGRGGERGSESSRIGR